MGGGGRFGVGLLFLVSYTEGEAAGPELSSFAKKKWDMPPRKGPAFEISQIGPTSPSQTLPRLAELKEGQRPSPIGP